MRFAICALTCVALLGACGGGSQYSSQRAQAQSPQPTYVPVTPGAVPVNQPDFIAVTPGAVPVTQPIQPTEPVLVASANPNASSLRPQARRTTSAPVQVASTQPAALQTSATAARPAKLFATGPIYSACREAGRKAATRSRCGCIQAVADRELTKSQQRRGAGYFKNQAKLQEVRQSDGAGNETFWTAWKAYGQEAARLCQ